MHEAGSGSGFVPTGTEYRRGILVYKPTLQFFSHPFLPGRPVFFEAASCTAVATNHRSLNLEDYFSNFQLIKFVCMRYY